MKPPYKIHQIIDRAEIPKTWHPLNISLTSNRISI